MLKPTLLNRTRRALLSAAILSLTTLSAIAAPPTVLSQLPADAKVVIVVNNVKTLSTKASNAAVRLNMTVPPDLAGYVTRLIGISKGFDFTGSAALAIVASPNPKEDGAPPAMLLLLPSTDPKAMMEGFQPGDPDKKNISEVTLPGDRGEKGYMATVEQWVVIAQDRTVLETYLARKDNLDKKLTPAALKSFEDNDLAVWVNIPEMTKGFDKILEDKQQEITGNLDLMNLKIEQSPITSALQKAAINEYFLAMKQYLKDANSAMLTVRLSDAGVTLAAISDFRPDSPMGKFIAAQKPTHPLTLQGLPSGDFLLATTLAWDPTSASNLAGDIFKRVLEDDSIAKDPDGKKFGTLLSQYQQLLQLTAATSAVLLEPAPGTGAKKTLFSGAYLVESPDAEKLKALQLEILNNSMAGELMGADITQETKITPDAVTIKGTKLTKIHTTFTLRKETAEKPVSEIAKKQIESINKLYGEDGLTMYSCVIGKRLLVILGSDAGIMEASVAAATTNSADLANHPALAAVKTEVAPNSVGIAYVSVGRFINMLESALLPGAHPPAAPANAAPLVLSAGVTDSILTLQMHIPTTTITTVKDAYTQFLQLMMGGGDNGGGMQP